MSNALGNPFELAARYEQARAVDIMRRCNDGTDIAPHERRELARACSMYGASMAKLFNTTPETVRDLGESAADLTDTMFGAGIGDCGDCRELPQTAADKLKQGDEEILEGLLTQPSVTAAASWAGISTDTVYRRLADPDFIDVYRGFRAARMEHIADRLDRASQIAIDELVDIITKDGAKDRDRIAAARAILGARVGQARIND